MNDKLPILNQDIFRECHGWQDKEGNIFFAKKHEEHFLIPIAEASMPSSVPPKKRCPACQLDFKRHRVRSRVRKHRIDGKRQERLEKYISLYTKWQSGEVQLDKSIIDKLKNSILEYGGDI